MITSSTKKAVAFAAFLFAIIVVVVWSAKQIVLGATAPPALPPPVGHPMTLSLSQAGCKAGAESLLDTASTLAVNGITIKAPGQPLASAEALESACKQRPMATVLVDHQVP